MEKMNEEAEAGALFIPVFILQAKGLSLVERMFLSYVAACKDGTWNRDKDFSLILGISEETVTRTIRKLYGMGAIEKHIIFAEIEMQTRRFICVNSEFIEKLQFEYFSKIAGNE